MVLFVLGLCYFLPSMFLKIPERRCFPSFSGRFSLLRTQLPCDFNPAALDTVKGHTFLCACSRLVGIGFESQPTPLPSSSQSSLHAMNNKWHTKTKWKSNVNTKQIHPMCKERREGQVKSIRIFFPRISLITWNNIRVLISSLMYANMKTRKGVLLLNLNGYARCY